MATDTSPGPSPSARRSRQWPLWFGLFGGVAAWTLHLAIAYPLVYNGCALGLDQLSTWLLILTAVLGAVALLATLAAFFTWRGATGAQASTDGSSAPALSAPGGMLGSRRLLGLMGMGLSGLSLLIMIFSAIAIVGLGPCYYH